MCVTKPGLRSPWFMCALACSALCDPMDRSPTGGSVSGVSQARRLQWVAISFSRGSSQPREEELERVLWIKGKGEEIMKHRPAGVWCFPWLSSVQSLSHVRLFAPPSTAARLASLSVTNSRSLPKLMSIKSGMPSNHLILCHPLLLLPSIFPSISSFPMSLFFASGGQSIGASASASALPLNVQY